MTQYFLGIDSGSQSTKVTVFDAHGHAVSEGRQALRPYDTPRPGVVEHPGDDLWESVASASRQALDAFPGDLGELAAAGARAAGLSVEDHLNAEAAKVPAGSEGLLTVLDWPAPEEAPFRKGSILGFDGRLGRYHVYRSVLEGLALALGAAGDRMATELGVEFDELVVSGGGSHSDLMMGVLADVFGLPARRAATGSAAGLGAAICAAVACGAYPDFPAAIAAMVRPGSGFQPDAGRHDLYARLGSVHARVREHTDPIYRMLEGGH